MSKPPPYPWRALAQMAAVFFAAMLVLHIALRLTA